MQSAVYEGIIRHRRLTPINHQLKYKLWMLYLDLDEIDELIAASPFWKKKGPAPVVFKRSDYLPETAGDLKNGVKDLVEKETGSRPEGPVRLLTHLRYWGVCFNPASFFYCFDKEGKSLEAVVIEVHNTPWGERHAYVLPLEEEAQKVFYFKKNFHVSPFNPLDMQYRCVFPMPGKHLTVHMENYKDGRKHFDATLTTNRKEILEHNLDQLAFKAVKIPFTVIGGIYIEALKLFLKKAPLYDHP